MSATLTFTTPPPRFSPLVNFVLDEIDGIMGVFSLRAAQAEAPGQDWPLRAELAHA